MAKKTKKSVAKKSGKKVVSHKKNVTAKHAVSPIIPLNDRVLLKELTDIETVRTTASGFILPESADKDMGGKRGKVVAVVHGRSGGDEVGITLNFFTSVNER
jgi:hypothetical protein